MEQLELHPRPADGGQHQADQQAVRPQAEQGEEQAPLQPHGGAGAQQHKGKDQGGGHGAPGQPEAWLGLGGRPYFGDRHGKNFLSV